MECENCGRQYNPVATRWRCPHCGWKSTCCEGEPAGITEPPGPGGCGDK